MKSTSLDIFTKSKVSDNMSNKKVDNLKIKNKRDYNKLPLDKRIDIEIGKKLREIRESSGESLRWVAYSIDISPSMLSCIELGRRSVPYGKLAILLRYYNYDYIEFLSDIPSLKFARTKKHVD